MSSQFDEMPCSSSTDTSSLGRYLAAENTEVQLPGGASPMRPQAPGRGTWSRSRLERAT